jgi:hypothetical protein
MKKYLLNFSFLIILIVSFVFLLDFSFNQKFLAQFPTFEIYPLGGDFYPKVDNVSVSPSTQEVGGTILVTARILDESGILFALLQVKSNSGDNMGSQKIMKDDGVFPDAVLNNGVYTIAFNTTGYANGQYFVDITARDRIGNTKTYPNIGNFSLGEPVTENCQTSQDAELCISTSLNIPTFSNPSSEQCETSQSATLCIKSSIYLPQ